MAEDKKKTLVESAKKTLAYHEKNPEKHPLYPDEWKKFWNKRYKEIQAGGLLYILHKYLLLSAVRYFVRVNSETM